MMSTVIETTATINSKDTNEHLSSDFLLGTSSDVTIEALVLLGVIVLCIPTASIAIFWISCRLCASDGDYRQRRAKRSTPTTSVYKWNTLTTERLEKHSPAKRFGLRLFKPMAQRILEMRSKLKTSAEHSNAENLQQAEKQGAVFINISS